MDPPGSSNATSTVEDTYLAQRFGLIEYIRRLREDQLSVLVPEVFHRNLIHSRFLFLHSFLVNKPEYIEHVLLTNQQNYVKSQFARTLLGPLLGDGLFLSEGAFWRRQRRIAALRAELERVLGGRAPGLADLAELRYTRMVFEEALRLYPPAHTIARTAVNEDWIGGVRIPPGAAVFISIYTTHRNPTLWPEPERFDPERFTPVAAAKRHRFAYLPFGGGPRICIGNGFAMAEALVILATIAQRYRLRLAPGHEVKPVGLVTLRPKHGIWMTVD